ncbi:MAG: 5-formyltetrahydrofolate cyclo-ligase [Pseudomonadota bacterium]
MRAKIQLRHDIRNIRQEFVKQQNIQDVFDLRAHILNILFTPGLTVAGYQKTGSEVSADTVLATAKSHHAILALPFIGARGEAMRFRQWRPCDRLVKSPFDFLQPAADTPDASPDIILAPLVGFDRDMNRLGQGAGHYDRIFMLFPNALRIGLAWSCQESLSIPIEPWDIPLDGVLTEKEWIKSAHSRIGF